MREELGALDQHVFNSKIGSDIDIFIYIFRI